VQIGRELPQGAELLTVPRAHVEDGAAPGRVHHATAVDVIVVGREPVDPDVLVQRDVADVEHRHVAGHGLTHIGALHDLPVGVREVAARRREEQDLRGGLLAGRKDLSTPRERAPLDG